MRARPRPPSALPCGRRAGPSASRRMRGFVTLTPPLKDCRAPPAQYTLGLRFVGADPATRIDRGPLLPGRVNYLLGADPAAWQTDLPTYGLIHYRALYPGVDLTYAGTDGRLKGTYTLAAGADPAQIRWRYSWRGGPGAECHGRPANHGHRRRVRRRHRDRGAAGGLAGDRRPARGRGRPLRSGGGRRGRLCARRLRPHRPADHRSLPELRHLLRRDHRRPAAESGARARRQHLHHRLHRVQQFPRHQCLPARLPGAERRLRRPVQRDRRPDLLHLSRRKLSRRRNGHCRRQRRRRLCHRLDRLDQLSRAQRLPTHLCRRLGCVCHQAEPER